MISHTCVGTNDLPRAAAFYDELFAVIGGKRFFEMDRGIGWGVKAGDAMFSVLKPFDGQPATVGNGNMVALKVASQDLVHALHAKAIELGGADEGAPGLRGASYYGCYFRDLDGNKIAAFFPQS